MVAHAVTVGSGECVRGRDVNVPLGEREVALLRLSASVNALSDAVRDAEGAAAAPEAEGVGVAAPEDGRGTA